MIRLMPKENTDSINKYRLDNQVRVRVDCKTDSSTVCRPSGQG